MQIRLEQPAMGNWVKSCGVLVYREQPGREFLLMRHTNRWDLPKGHVDDNETELQCALRELWEETGIRQPQIRLDPTFRFTHDYTFMARKTDTTCQKTLVVFLAELIDDVTIVLTEHLSFAWHPWNPPHQIQAQTIDPLLSAVEAHWH